MSSSDGVPIHYLEGGRGSTALVFVHGWLGNAGWWEPVMRHFGIPATLRASFSFYNTLDEVEALARGLGRVREVFG